MFIFSLKKTIFSKDLNIVEYPEKILLENVFSSSLIILLSSVPPTGKIYL